MISQPKNRFAFDPESGIRPTYGLVQEKVSIKQFNSDPLITLIQSALYPVDMEVLFDIFSRYLSRSNQI